MTPAMRGGTAQTVNTRTAYCTVKHKMQAASTYEYILAGIGLHIVRPAHNEGSLSHTGDVQVRGVAWKDGQVEAIRKPTLITITDPVSNAVAIPRIQDEGCSKRTKHLCIGVRK